MGAEGLMMPDAWPMIMRYQVRPDGGFA